MAFRMQDFRCNDCKAIFEVLLDSRKANEKGEIHVTCEICESNNVEHIITAGTGNKSHVSWSSWRILDGNPNIRKS
jgi:hypothetical protein